MNLTLDERTKIFGKVCRLVETKHFNPAMNGADWNALVRSRRAQIIACDDPEAFEKEVNRLVAELKTSHTGFRHAGMRNIPARHAINATLHRLAMNGTDRWMFQDVHRGGPAYLAGIRPGDLLLGYGEREIRPPEDLTFSAGELAQLTIQKLDGGVQGVSLQLPMPKDKKHPITAPEAVHAEMLTDEIGLLKVAMFPGAIGIDVAKDIDRGIAALSGCSRLIVDLRGNTGGGIGGLRLMSYLTPGKLEVGYSLTRKRRERGYRREELTRFGRIPSRKGNSPLAGSTIRLCGQVHPCSHGRPWPTPLSRTCGADGERAHRECWRNGVCLCRGEQTRNYCWSQDTRSFVEWGRLQGGARVHSRITRCCLSDLAGQDVRKQWDHSGCFC